MHHLREETGGLTKLGGVASTTFPPACHRGRGINRPSSLCHRPADSDAPSPGGVPKSPTRTRSLHDRRSVCLEGLSDPPPKGERGQASRDRLARATTLCFVQSART